MFTCSAYPMVFFVVAFVAACQFAAEPENVTLESVPSSSSYCGCLLFVDDVKSFDDFRHMQQLPMSSLTRSWYRFGEPEPDKAYELRRDFVNALRQRHIAIGGGGSLS